MQALIIPTRWECRPIIRSLAGVQRLQHRDFPVWQAGNVLILEPGMGPSRTSKAIKFLEQLDLSQLWLFGWCGGLSEDLATGDLVLSSATQFPDPEKKVPHRITDQLHRRLQQVASETNLSFATGPVMTSDKVLKKPEEKSLAARSGAIAIEMEAGPLAEWTRVRHDLEFVHLRIVVDTRHSELPPLLTVQNFGDCTRLLNPIPWLRPQTWNSILLFVRQTRLAKKNMNRFIVALTQADQPLSPQHLD